MDFTFSLSKGFYNRTSANSGLFNKSIVLNNCVLGRSAILSVQYVIYLSVVVLFLFFSRQI